MVHIRQYKQITVPCRDRDTKSIQNFMVSALDFEHAKYILLNELDNNWQIGV